MLSPHLAQLTDYPFQRLRDLLAGLSPPDGLEPISLALGEPQQPPPTVVEEILADAFAQWGRYPPVDGTPAWRQAVAGWLDRRYGLDGAPPPALPLAGSREGLFMVSQLVVPPHKSGGRPVVLVPNPFYQVYAGGALMAGAEVVFVPATAQSGFVPDFAAVDPEVLGRTVLAFLCSPNNPIGTVAPLDYLERTIDLAREHGFVLACDECYSEIWSDAPPPGAFEACRRLGGGYDGVLVFQSLSKRSSVAGLRSGFVAGDPALIEAFRHLRSYAAATVPGPVQAASAVLWADETHVEETRAGYQETFARAARVLGERFGPARPAGGFFLWLDVGDGVAAARVLWQRAAVRVLPGAYLARDGADGANPGHRFIRVALVHDPDTCETALRRLVKVL